MKKVKSFWNTKLNPITMWRNLKPPKKEPILDPEIRQADQASIFKPKGFH